MAVTEESTALERDRALLDGFRAGDRVALTRVFRMYVADLASTVRAGVTVVVEGRRVRLGDHLPEHEVDVILQETFARAFSPKARASYDGLRPFGAYLATIARNLVIDRGRALVRDGQRIAPVDVNVVEDDAAVDPSWKIEEEQLARIAGAFRSSLTEPDLSIFRCRFEQHMSVREAAKALDLGLIVVRRRETRLRAALLDALREHGFLQNAKVRIGASLLARRNSKT